MVAAIGGIFYRFLILFSTAALYGAGVAPKRFLNVYTSAAIRFFPGSALAAQNTAS